MPLTFPTSPTTGQTYLNYIWDGVKWKNSTTLGVEPPASIDMDGGMASVVYEINLNYADGGGAEDVFGPSDVKIDGNGGSYELDGGVA